MWRAGLGLCVGVMTLCMCVRFVIATLGVLFLGYTSLLQSSPSYVLSLPSSYYSPLCLLSLFLSPFWFLHSFVFLLLYLRLLNFHFLFISSIEPVFFFPIPSPLFIPFSSLVSLHHFFLFTIPPSSGSCFPHPLCFLSIPSFAQEWTVAA